MSGKTFKALVMVLALCIGIGTYSLYQLHQAETPINAETIIGQTRPEFSLYDLDMRLRDIKEWQGKVIILNFWGTWCPPCLKEIPDLNAFYTAYRDRDIALIGIAHDTPAKVREFKQNMNMEYAQLVDPMLAVELSRAYGNEFGTLPYTVVIDKDNIVRYVHQHGVIDQAGLSKVVEPLLQ